ncbi:MAG: Cobalamin-binding protein [Candidatus Poribacteria bacterium]|nr:Cobalamin-binding protein [Candidatus Poribacteria bacterium]
MRKLIIITVLIIATCLSFYGCSKKTSSRNTVLITDPMGREVKVPKNVKRIVSMAPNVTEMLFAIGLDNEIVGVTDYCNYPESAKNKTKIGGYYNPNVEVILSLTPDLIIATPDGYSKERIDKLDQTGIPIFIVNPQNINDVMVSMALLGKVTGKEEFANQVVENMRSRIKIIKGKVSQIPEQKRPKVFYAIGEDPLVTVGPNNVVNDLLTIAGGINVALDAPNSWPVYNVEAVIMKNPDVILTAPSTMTSSDKNAQIAKWNKYRTVSAVINGKIYAVDPDIMLRSGPRVVDGLEKLYSLFYQN